MTALTKTHMRRLGAGGPEVSALGMGCWAIGGEATLPFGAIGWGEVNDEESVRALRRAYDLGVNFFDTADIYGCGHSERLVARALGDVRNKVVIATKVGYVFSEQTRAGTDESGEPEHIRSACEQSLRRLKTDYIDLYQFHLGNFDLERAPEVLGAFEGLVSEGKVRSFGWSTDDPARAAFFARSPHCKAIQQAFNIIWGGNTEVLELCEQRELASIVRGPLAMGFLTGKYTADSQFPVDDVRHKMTSDASGADKLRDWLTRLDGIREILTSQGRTLAQGSLAWLWARSPVFIPIPGFKTVAQVEENVGALQFGPLTHEEMAQIEKLMQRSA